MANASNSSLMKSYYLYSALLALKLLTLSPLASLMMCNPMHMRRVHVSDLKQLTPFWLIAAFYTTTSPDQDVAVGLFRMFLLARIISALAYLKRIPRLLDEAAFVVSFSITAYMGLSVVYAYREAF